MRMELYWCSTSRRFVEGRPSRTSGRGFLDEVGGSANIESVEIAGAGDLAYQWATYSLEGGEQSDTGKFVEIYNRQADGSWKIRLTIFNSDNP